MAQEFRLLSVNVSRPRDFEFQGKPARSSIWKTPVEGPVQVRGVNLEGDDQADREVHGGRDKAIYAYAIEDIRWWEEKLSRPLELSAFGENLTTSGIDVNASVIGEKWAIGTTVLEVSQPRSPCWKLGVKMGDPKFPKKFTKTERPGAYLRILREGILSAGDRIEVVDQPLHGVRIADVFRIYTRERKKAPLLLGVPELSEDWKEWARRTGA